ncbi:MAG: phosphomannomutase/phosphoglucomutase [Chlamydiales bacterium]|nr:phosphomannomutase/phosphoglucomutase [Chlamydiales bacterium]
MKRLSFFLLFFLRLQFLLAEADPAIFREYDIRGIVDEQIAVEDIPDIALAIVTYLRTVDNTVKTLAIGSDGRVHSPPIKAAMVNTLLKHGFDIIDIGTCTTPVMYYASHKLSVDAALMITASHNPGNYNGIKIRLGQRAVSGDEIRTIRDFYFSKSFISMSPQLGVCKDYDLITDYIDYLATHFSHLVGKKIDAVIDCGNGAAGTVLPALIKAMQWEDSVSLLFSEVDGTYPNHVADPTSEKNMADLKKVVLNSPGWIGIGLDGDCDRMAPMTSKGLLIKGDQLLALFSKPLLENNPDSRVVFDISSSLFLHQLIKNWGGTPLIAKTGISNVSKMMSDNHAAIGGEISCHTIFSDRYFGFDDGIYSMMRLFEMLHESKLTLEEMVAILPNCVSSPTYRLPCERSACLELIDELYQELSCEEGTEIIAIDGIRIHYPDAWAIVRPSNTEPLASIRFEGRTQQDLEWIEERFAPIINRYVEFIGSPKPVMLESDCSPKQKRFVESLRNIRS